MGRKLRLVAAIAMVSACLSAPIVAQQSPPLTAADVTRIKQEVTAAVDKYYTLFSAHDMKALPEQTYNIPWILMTGNGPQVDLTKEQAVARFEGSLKQLVDSGWGKSVYTTTNVCVLSPASAITSGYNTRYKKDGSVMSVGGVAYVFNRTKEGWRIITYTSTAKDTLIKCD